MRSTLLSLFLCYSICTYSDEIAPQASAAIPGSYTPYYSGTLLAFFSQNVPPGQLDFEPYLYQTTIPGFYSNKGTFEKTKPTHTYVTSFLLETGITQYFDFALMLNATYNQFGSHQSLLYQDTQAYLGIQILKDIKGSWIPDIRLVLGESFPTGTYQKLDTEKEHSDSSGLGSYVTSFTLATKKIFYSFPKHPFNICLNLQYSIATKTNVQGYNVYGGAPDTKGTVSPGNGYMVNLSGELSLTQNWVVGADIHYIHQNKSTFTGHAGATNPFVGLLASDQLSLAPCLEYNFNANFGVLAASWFTVSGRNSNRFITNCFSAYWVF